MPETSPQITEHDALNASCSVPLDRAGEPLRCVTLATTSAVSCGRRISLSEPRRLLSDPRAHVDSRDLVCRV